MAKYPKLKNPPISEAAIEVRFSKPLEEFDSISQPLLKELEKSYPQKKEMRTVEFAFRLDAEKASRPLQEKLGYRLEDQAKETVLQLKRDGIVLSNVQHYDCWDVFLGKFKTVWDIFSKQAHPCPAIARVGVRFINKFTLPSKHEDYYRRWLILNTDSAEIKKSSLAYLLEEGDFKSIVKIAARKDNNGKFEMQLDIDVFCEKVIDADKIESTLSDLRILKNRLFFQNINPDIIEEFN